MEFIKNSPYAKLARAALEHFLKTGKEINLPPNFADTSIQAAVYVSIKKDGQNRGCMGSFAEKPNIGLEIIHNAIMAGVHDPRFWAVKLDEFKELRFSVDVLSQPAKVEIEALNPAEYGVIVNSGKKHGVLLPAQDGIETAQQQLETVKSKAKILPNERCEIYRFVSIRHLEE